MAGEYEFENESLSADFSRQKGRVKINAADTDESVLYLSYLWGLERTEARHGPAEVRDHSPRLVSPCGTFSVKKASKQLSVGE